MPAQPESASWPEDWKLRIRVWLERADAAVLADGQLELLERIDRCHSISAAARQLGISYRHAWVQVAEANAAAGAPLVEAATGGRHGGGARLTACGQAAVALFRQLREHLRAESATLLPRLRADGVRTASLHVAAAASLEEVLGEFAGAFGQQQPGAQVRLLLGASDELADQIVAGAMPDLFLSADAEQLHRLTAAGLLMPEPVTPIARNTLAAITSAESEVAARKPGDLLGRQVTRIALAAPTSPLGGYTQTYLDELGLYDTFAQRAVMGDNARAVVAAVQSGRADAGIVYGSASATAGCRVLFRVRRPALGILYGGAILTASRNPQRARQFLEFLASRSAAHCWRRHGFRFPP